MKEFEFQIGQLVAVTNHPYFKSVNEEIHYFGTLTVCSSDNYPLMLVKEYIRSILRKQDFDKSISEVNDKNYIEDKYLCSWYDSTLGKFQEAWFRSDSLVSFPNQLLPHLNPNKSNLLKTVFLKTTIIERYKRINGSNNRMNDRFVSSSFIVRDFKWENQCEWTHKELGHCEKLISKVNVKVQWFNVAKGKYSEEWLPIEFFQETPQLFDSNKRALLDFEENKSGTLLMKLISDKKFNFHPQNSEDGKNLEGLIFYYINSGQKIILDDRVLAFHQYLKEKDYEIEKFNIHINSNGNKNFKNLYSPLDLLVKIKGTADLVAIDLISGNGLVKDDNILSLLKTPDNSKEINELSLYNGRAFIIQELLKKKYQMPNVCSKLLVINSKLPNLIKEFDVIECTFSLGCVQKEIIQNSQN